MAPIEEVTFAGMESLAGPPGAVADGVIETGTAGGLPLPLLEEMAGLVELGAIFKIRNEFEDNLPQ